MKLRHLSLTLALSVGCGWWLHSREQSAKPSGRASVPVAMRVSKSLETPRTNVAIEHVEEVRRSPQSVHDFVLELKRLKACEESEQCAYPQTDPRSYAFALAQDIKKQLFRFAEWVRSENLESRDVSEVAREFLGHEDGFVQAAALDLISTQPTATETRDMILRHVIDGHDSELIEQAMLELERYTRVDDRDVIAQALGRALTTGAPYVARAISVHIAPFVDQRSYRLFRDVLGQLPPDSIYYELLEASLNAVRDA